ncbi:MAG: hypothetical protein LBC17_02670 [Lactobacillaceae bacterium]|jgi:protein-tyrosine phosphatase|nr:hypothetical protein [Lactobacillaceae bacterium]
MIDLNSHLLQATKEKQNEITLPLEYAKKIVKEGIDGVVFSPPSTVIISNEETINYFLKSIDDIRKKLKDQNVKLDIFANQVVEYSDDLLKRILDKKIIGVNNNLSYILIEFQNDSLPENSTHVFFEMVQSGITPILVHPERNKEIAKTPQILAEFIDIGVIHQMDANSFLGKFGSGVKKFATDLLDNGFIHLVASESEIEQKVVINLKNFYKKAYKRYDKENVKALEENSNNILNGKPIEIFAYNLISAKKVKRYKI